MNKRNRTLLICLLSLCVALGCNQVARHQPTEASQPTMTLQPTTRYQSTASPQPNAATQSTARLQATATSRPMTRPQATVTSQPTTKSQAIVTPQSTARYQPTAKSQSAATAMPGWRKFEGGGAELWLPKSYVFKGKSRDNEGNTASVSKEFDDLAKQIKYISSLFDNFDFDQINQMIEQNPLLFDPSIFTIWGYDTKVGDNGILTLAAVAPVNVPSSMSASDYLDAATGQLPHQFQVLERDTTSLTGRQTERLIIKADFQVLALTGKELIYVVKDGDTMWVIVYATGITEFDQRLPDFEQSILTFTIQPR